MIQTSTYASQSSFYNFVVGIVGPLYIDRINDVLGGACVNYVYTFVMINASV